MTTSRKLVASILTIAALLPLLAFSQTTPNICLIARTSYLQGSQGAEVAVIQSFLKDQGFFNREPTGYFGGVTARAVAQFQFSTGIIANLSDGGVWGRRTWGYVVPHYCTAGVRVSSPQDSCPVPPQQPTNVSCDSGWQKIMNNAGCHVGWSCVTYSTVSTTTDAHPNHAPSIFAIQGPLTLTSGVAGTWVIRASDQDNDALTYSMIWGDEGVNLTHLLDLSGQGTNYSSSNSFTHTYQNAGGYTMVGYVKDAPGNTNKATLSLTVSDVQPATSTTPSTSCLMGGVTYTDGTTIPNPVCANTTLTCTASQYLTCHSGVWSAGSQAGTPGSSGILSASPTSGNAPLSVTFTVNFPGSGVRTDIGAIEWNYRLDFGDGNSQAPLSCSRTNPDGSIQGGGQFGTCTFVHTYYSSGTYTARLINGSNACVAELWTACNNSVVGTATIVVGGAGPFGECGERILDGCPPHNNGTSCVYNGQSYAAGTQTQGYSTTNLCLPSGTCAYLIGIHTYECQSGQWVQSTDPTTQCAAGFGWCPAPGGTHACRLLVGGTCPIN